jgi:hypothetical protein
MVATPVRPTQPEKPTESQREESPIKRVIVPKIFGSRDLLRVQSTRTYEKAEVRSDAEKERVKATTRFRFSLAGAQRYLLQIVFEIGRKKTP